MRIIMGAFLPLFMLGCSTLTTDVETVLQDARQPATEKPLYVYRADLQITTDAVAFDGVGVTKARTSPMDIDVVSQINIDRVEVETCARQDVCEHGKPCTGNFQIDQTWFGAAGNHMVYHYLPSTDESTGTCPIYFRIYSKVDLAAWGFLAFRSAQENLPGHMICNGVPWSFAGHSMCQTKAGLIQRLTFDQDIEDFDVDKNCGLQQLDKRTFLLRPLLGLCTGEFESQGKWHGLDLIAYKMTLVGGAN